MITRVGSVGRLNLQNTIHVRTVHKHFMCACTLKHTHTNEDYVSLRGHFSVAGEQLMWQTIQQMERGREMKGENEKEKERREKERERVRVGWEKSFSSKQLQLSFRFSRTKAYVSS